MGHYSEAIKHSWREIQMKQCCCIGPQNGDPVCPCRMPAYREAEAGKMALEWLRKNGRQKRKPRVRVKALDLATIIKMAMRAGYEGRDTGASLEDLWVGYDGDCTAMERVQEALYGNRRAVSEHVEPAPEDGVVGVPWVKAAIEALEAYEADYGDKLPEDHELGRIEESRGSPSFRIRVGHIRSLCTSPPPPSDPVVQKLVEAGRELLAVADTVNFSITTTTGAIALRLAFDKLDAALALVGEVG